MSNALYNQLKFIAQVLLPALGTLYFALANWLNLPSAEWVVGIIITLDAVLGVLLYISTTQHKGVAPGGELIVREIGDKKIFSLELNDDPEILETRDEVIFKVKHSS